MPMYVLVATLLLCSSPRCRPVWQGQQAMSNYQIFVTVPDGKTITVNIAMTSTTGDIIAKVNARRLIPVLMTTVCLAIFSCVASIRAQDMWYTGWTPLRVAAGSVVISMAGAQRALTIASQHREQFLTFAGKCLEDGHHHGRLLHQEREHHPPHRATPRRGW